MPDDAASGPFGTASPLAAPLAAAYGAGVLLRRWAFDRGWMKAERPPCFTVSVGGLEAGGTGKTPVASLLLGALRDAGHCPGLLTRGYGRATRGLVTRERGQAPDPAAIGDEPAMIALEHDLAVAACAERVVGARALASLGCDALVMDDGFAHRHLARDVDIVVLRGEAPLGNGHLLPWGTLREPLTSLRRAHILWFHHRRPVGDSEEERLPEVPDWVRQVAPDAAIVTSRAIPSPLRDLAGEAIEPPTRVVVAAGVARPGEVAGTLRAQGMEVACLVPFRDHHVYTAADVERLLGAAATTGAAAVVVTAKDAVKLRALWPSGSVPLCVIGTQIRMITGRRGLARLLGLPQSWAGA